ncbi:hypothetical protein [Clostridium septicum]|uniref:hypothetical protein n=1 Tax=Clostridium septicum TaxID=1504 RepID=UPI000FF8E0FB|nr:hypothetical protein [Clostridium septicum]QAS60168.1 hypothetical protein EI377_05125 [Clostridium septicum]
MFSLWYKLAFLDGDIISKIKKIIKSICIYILPTIVAIIVSDKVLIRVQYNLFGTVTNIIVFNLLYSSIIHIYIQKKTLSSLQGDVIVKFVPQKFNVYIILRVLMVFIKTYLPIITLSILTFKDIFINPVYIFYICSLAFIISIIFLNVIIAILYRYLLNIVNKLIYKLINFITFIYITSLVIYQSTVTPIWYLESLERYLKKEDLILNKIDINFFQIMLILIIFILSIMSINFLKNFLKIRGRNLIFIKNISVNEKSNKITKVIEDYCEKVYSIYFSNIEKSFFVKDIKEAVRTNKYSLFFNVQESIKF